MVQYKKQLSNMIFCQIDIIQPIDFAWPIKKISMPRDILLQMFNKFNSDSLTPKVKIINSGMNNRNWDDIIAGMIALRDACSMIGAGPLYHITYEILDSYNRGDQHLIVEYYQFFIEMCIELKLFIKNHLSNLGCKYKFNIF